VNAPLLVNDRPFGNAPAVTANELGAVPPVAVSVCEYAVLTKPFGKLAGFTVMVAHGGLMKSAYARSPKQPLASVARTVKLNGPWTVGVPPTNPPPASVKPLGNAPALTVNPYGPVPPLALRVWL